MKSSLLVFICCWLILTVAGCAGSTSPVEGPGQGTVSLTVSLPFVEDVRLPSHVAANEDFSIEFELSSVLEPAALNGYFLNSYRNVFGAYDPQPGDTVVISTYTGIGDQSDPPAQSALLEMNGLPAGTYTLSITTAASRTQGGTSFDIEVPFLSQERWLPSEHIPDDPAVSSIELELTVYPE
ncbi:hypothetical protein JW859_08480 [bacterium]|nr:hypothetical protein [bacterium]